MARRLTPQFPSHGARSRRSTSPAEELSRRLEAAHTPCQGRQLCSIRVAPPRGVGVSGSSRTGITRKATPMAETQLLGAIGIAAGPPFPGARLVRRVTRNPRRRPPRPARSGISARCGGPSRHPTGAAPSTSRKGGAPRGSQNVTGTRPGRVPPRLRVGPGDRADARTAAPSSAAGAAPSPARSRAGEGKWDPGPLRSHSTGRRSAVGCGPDGRNGCGPDGRADAAARAIVAMECPETATARRRSPGVTPGSDNRAPRRRKGIGKKGIGSGVMAERLSSRRPMAATSRPHPHFAGPGPLRDQGWVRQPRLPR